MSALGRFAILLTILGVAIYHLPERPLETFDLNEYEHIQSLEEFHVEILDEEDFLVKIDPKEFDCMRTNMYYEARNQRTDEAYAAVGFTVLNRIENRRYPKTVCEVVQQAHRDSRGNPIRHKCQFSWFCDGKSNTPNLTNVIERRAWERAGRLAEAVMRGDIENPIGNATMYHAHYVSPYWRKAYARVATIESHIFYQET